MASFVPSAPLFTQRGSFSPPAKVSFQRSVPITTHTTRAKLAEEPVTRIAATPLPKVDFPIARVVLIVGFETFNLSTYKSACAALHPFNVQVSVLTDRQLPSDTAEEVLKDADVVFCSLIFDYDQVEWLRKQLSSSSTIFVFESALELMSETRVGTFTMSQRKGMPPAIKNILKKLGLAGREEDKLAGYLALLKTLPKFLKLVPGNTARDLRNWMKVYEYWNAGGKANVVAMIQYIVKEVMNMNLRVNIREVVQMPNVGVVHPKRKHVFESPGDYIKWYFQKWPERKTWARVGVLLYRKHVVSGLKYIDELITMMEDMGVVPVPVFITGVEAHIVARDLLTSDSKENLRGIGERVYGSFRGEKRARVDAVVSTIGFPLVGGPAGSMGGGRNMEVGQKILKQLNVPYMIGAPLLIQDLESWRGNGVGGLQSVVLYALPELDGAIDTVCIGGIVGEDVVLERDRVQRLVARITKWVQLRRKTNEEKKVAVIVYGFPPGIGATGTAALLDVEESLKRILDRLKAEGYDVGGWGTEARGELIKVIKERDEFMQGGKLPNSMEDVTIVEKERLSEWLDRDNVNRIEKAWGGEALKMVGGKYVLGGLRMGNVWIGVQPPLGVVGDPMRMLFERDLTPHPQYATFYRWLQCGFGADAVVHLGMHGTVEWLPGNALGNTRESWSDVLVADMPNLYVYAANNPSEASLAKRRGYATVISHAVPPYGRAGLYGVLEELKGLVAEFREAEGTRRDEIREVIEEKLKVSGLDVDLGIEQKEAVAEFVSKIATYLKQLEVRLFSSGLHVLGEAPTPEEAVAIVEAVLAEGEGEGDEVERMNLAKAVVANLIDVSTVEGAEEWKDEDILEREDAKKAGEIVEKLMRSGRELDNIIRGLNGEFIEALPGGDVLRDGGGVLPTGANIHSLDPYRMPSAGAFETGRKISERVVQKHWEENDEWPETIAVPLWGLDNIKTRGESVGIVLGLLGAKPVLDGTGRVVRFELVDLEELGRPRVDVLMNLSGIFRDSFENVVFLLDDVFRRAADVDEPVEMNYVKKHVKTLEQEGEDVDAAARLFSNPPGDYGSMVNEVVAEGSWDEGDELAETYVKRNAYSYGRKGMGKRSEEAFRKVLKTTSRVVQQIDSVEYGLSDIQEYYANTGALIRAARKEGKGKVGTSIVESYGSSREPKELEEVLRMELRTRLLNPKWADKMLEKGGGAFEVSSRMTALIGWGGTAGYGDDFVFEQAAERYVLDEKNRDRLKKSPEAFRNVLTRFLEAAGRGIWQNPDEELLQRVRSEIEDIESEIEGVV